MPAPLPAAPISYALGIAEVHVWKVYLPSRDDALGALPAILSQSELERAARFHFEQDRARFIACRATLRVLLSRYAGTAPERLTFRYEPGGKPALTGDGGWQFNVSHSRDVAAIAISRSDPVGIDIERINPDFPRADVAPDVFAPDELNDLAALPPDEQPAYFFQLWTLKEALLKTVGAGLSIEPVAIRIRHDATLGPHIVSAPPDLLGASLHTLSLDADYASALAVRTVSPRITCFQWYAANGT